MRIFQIVTVSEYGGAQTVVANLIKNLSNDHEVFVLYGGEGEAWSRLGDNFTRIRLGKHRKAISLWDLILFFKLIFYRFKYRPDIVHLHSSKMGVLGRLAFSRRKVILTMHGFDSVRKGFPYFLKVEKALKNHARYIVGVSRYDVEQLAEEGIHKNVKLIYNGTDDHLIDNDLSNLFIENKLKTIKTEYKFIVMCIARIAKQKKFDLFIEIASHMPNMAFVWFGNKKTIEGLPVNVFCMGEIYAAYNYYKYADVFILPSNYEGLPISLLEALSYSLPSVASAVGGITEVLDGKNGFFVNNSYTEFKDKIEYIIEDEQRYNFMAECARKTYIANFTVEKMINGYLSLYNEIAGK